MATNYNNYSNTEKLAMIAAEVEYIADNGFSGGEVDKQMSDTSTKAVQNKVIKAYVDDATQNLQGEIDALGEPFRIKQWAPGSLEAVIPSCTADINNTQIDKMVFRITGKEAEDYQIAGMIAYEIFGSDGKRINCWPVCQFTGQNQTELNVRWMCGGTTSKTATKINAWVLLKHR